MAKDEKRSLSSAMWSKLNAQTLIYPKLSYQSADFWHAPTFILKNSFQFGKRLRLLKNCNFTFILIQFSSVAQSCPTPCNPMNRSTPGLPVHHQLPEFTQIHIWVSDAIQPSHPQSSPSPPAPNPSQHHSLFQWVNTSHEVAKVLEFQLQDQSF